jgi:hypothetical protein
VWGGFTETERLRLLSIGWQDASQRYRRRVDVGQLEAKLRVDSAAGYVPIHPRNRILADIHTDLVITG